MRATKGCSARRRPSTRWPAPGGAARPGPQGARRPRFDADLVVYDPVTVAERSTFQDPHQYPSGLPHVIVNGVFAVRDGGTPARWRAGLAPPGTDRLTAPRRGRTMG